jgi:hypothetical protein
MPFHGNPSSADRLTNVTKLIGAFRDNAKGLKTPSWGYTEGHGKRKSTTGKKYVKPKEIWIFVSPP